MIPIPKLIISATVISLAWICPGHDTAKEKLSAEKEWVKEITRKYSPDSWDLLMHYESLPEKMEAESTDGRMATTEKSVGTFFYLEGKSKLDLLASMATNVHEIAHAYCGLNIFRHARENGLKLDMNKAEEFFYFSPGRSFFISFPLRSLFPSRELKASIPKPLRTFRYDTYINGITSTQSEGVIGLLNELHSYYLESKFCLEMLEPYKTAEGSEAWGLFEWVHNTQSKMTAFYEFDYFIKEYFLLMKHKYPSRYNELKRYRPFVEAYNDIRKSYEELVSNYLLKIKSEIAKLNSSGKAEVTLEGYDLWVREGSSDSSTGTPVFSKDLEVLAPVLESDRYKEIMDDFPLE
jgi:hypothetical protein